ncbi:MAG: ABC transporter permease [Chlamydiae bacterium]|jgi:oligopeptide transport system permease protein|nr:ABC transporter permease [Chlamydiota bacterium]
MSWAYYLTYKFFTLVLSLFLVATATFTLMHIIPGDPFSQEQTIPDEILKSLMAHYELDQPILKQYFHYLEGLTRFDLGPSFKYEGRMIQDIIKEGFGVSATLGAVAILISVVAGATLGSLAAFCRGKWQDWFSMLLAVIGMSVPSFILATLLQYVFAMKFNLLPIARWGELRHIILPAISLSAFPTAFIARLVRNNMVEILEQEYIVAAKARGLGTAKILIRHVTKNCILPVLSYLGPLFANIITGSFVIEKIFGIPGLGGWFVMSITNRDYTMIMGITLFYSAILMVAVFIVDLLSYSIDPRIRSSR